MLPEIQDGDMLHVAAVSTTELRCGEIVLVKLTATVPARTAASCGRTV